MLAQQETTNKSAEAREDHRDDNPPTDDCGTEERSHAIRIILAHLGRDVRVVGVGSKENRSERADHPQGEQRVCCDVSRGIQIATTAGDKVSQETKDKSNRYGHPRMSGHDHQESNDARHDRDRPEHTRAHHHQHDDRTIEDQTNNKTDEHERGPKEAKHSRAPHENEIDSSKSADGDSRARFCHSRA